MEHFLINSSACLFVLWLTYKLLLENTSWHRFKRWFLLCAIIVSLIIPFIVVETVIIPIKNTPMLEFTNIPIDADLLNQPEEFTINWDYVLLLVYIIGAVIMLWRFVKNLNAFRIQNEDTLESYGKYELILRRVFTVPHSFLRRIFVSKEEYEKGQIPLVVMEHEKAHLDQQHSLDILLIEILLVLFWFNPLLYILRYSIKLNHEFLADQAVIQQGNPVNDYQKTLLHYTQQSHSTALANTFNFPIIKKRFQIMKTQTSNTSLVLRSLALIPVLTLLIISCGKEETQIQEVEDVIEVVKGNQKQIVVDGSTPNGNITIQGEPYYYNIKDDKVEIYDKYGTLQDFESQGYEVFAVIEEVIEVLENVTEDNIAEYNELAKKHKAYMEEQKQLIVWQDETLRMQLIFNSMDENQKVAAESWPYTGNHYGIEYTDGQVPPPPPPAPASALNYINENKNELNFYLREDQISAETAINIIEKYGQSGVEISPDSKGVMSIKIKETENNKGLLPPPPPPAPLKASGYIKVDERIYFYTTKKGDHNFYDRQGNVIDIKGKKVIQVEQEDLPPPPPPVLKVTSQDDKDTTAWVKDFSSKEQAEEVSEWVKESYNQQTSTDNESKWKEIKEQLIASTPKHQKSLDIQYKTSDTTYVFKDENGNLKNLYMTYQPSGEVISADLSKVELRKPTTNQLKAWKAKPEEFAVWYNGKPITNSELQSIDLEEIKHYNSSFVYENARSDKYPQPYQVSIFDDKGFEYAYRSNK